MCNLKHIIHALKSLEIALTCFFLALPCIITEESFSNNHTFILKSCFVAAKLSSAFVLTSCSFTVLFEYFLFWMPVSINKLFTNSVFQITLRKTNEAFRRAHFILNIKIYFFFEWNYHSPWLHPHLQFKTFIYTTKFLKAFNLRN